MSDAALPIDDPAGLHGATEPVPEPQARVRYRVLNTLIDVLSFEEAIARIDGWAARGESRSVFACNVHSVCEAFNDADFEATLDAADLCTPDGAPVAWMLRRLAAPSQPRVCGPDLMWGYFAHAEQQGRSVFLYGSDPQTMAALQTRIAQTFPKLHVAGWHCPPFRELTSAENAEDVETIRRSGAQSVWVSLGCPRQERWIAAHRGVIPAVMIGVGAAFGFHAQTLPRAPAWMQRAGLEWMHRLLKEPRRLWRRYFHTNSLFLLRAAQQLVDTRANARTGSCPRDDGASKPP